MNKEELIRKIAELLTEKMIIGENPTNGDVIKAMFPNEEFNFGKSIKDKNVVYKGIYAFCKLDWWNAPYEVDKE